MKKEIQGKIQEYFSDQHIRIIKEYHSKKNTVVLVNNQGVFLIVKLFDPSNKDGMKREEELLSMLPPEVHSPQLYRMDGDHHLIIMEYLPGENLCEFLHDPTYSFVEKSHIIDHLALWFSTFHQWAKKNKTPMVKGDVNIRNFIVFNNTVYGVDFEEASTGSQTNDIAECCVSILFTKPVMTNEKIEWCKQVKKTYQNNVSWALEDFEACFSKQLYKFIKRRENPEELLRIMTVKEKRIKEIIHL